MTLLASCSAWRKSPLFSLKTTVNLVGATVLIIALIVGITQWHLSLDAQIIVLPLLVVAVEIFGTALLIRVSDSHIARLPSSVKPLTVYRQKAFQWIWRLLVFLLVCTAATLILPSSWRWLPSGLGLCTVNLLPHADGTLHARAAARFRNVPSHLTSLGPLAIFS